MFAWPFAPTQGDGWGDIQLSLRAALGPARSRDRSQSHVQLWKISVLVQRCISIW